MTADNQRTSRVAIEITTVLGTSCLRAGRVEEILNREYITEIERLRKALRICAEKGDIVIYEFAKQALGEHA